MNVSNERHLQDPILGSLPFPTSSQAVKKITTLFRILPTPKQKTLPQIFQGNTTQNKH
jgi:hypothetical protein